MNRLLAIWHAGRVRRWHNNPHLSHTDDPDDGHAARVATMALALKPDLSRDGLSFALTHDLGEHAVGDFSYEIKRLDPALRDRLGEIEEDARAGLGFLTPALDLEERLIIKMCDSLDAWLWMVRHEPGLRARSDWHRQKHEILDLAEQVGAYGTVAGLFHEIEVNLSKGIPA